jgi:ribosomal protein S18 acetylase RimI-like enzyme
VTRTELAMQAALSRDADKATLEAFLLEQPAVNIYAIGDLDPSCWGDCVWDVLREPRADGDGALRAVALTYRGLAVPVLQVLADPQDPAGMDAAKRVLELLAAAAPERLPAGAFEAHLNAGLEAVLRDAGFVVDVHPHLRMVLGTAELAQLRADSPPRGQDCTAELQRLTPADADACMDLCATLERSWFEPQCLDSGMYYGVYGGGDDGGALLAMGGTHVAAQKYRVAALGNIATRTSHRRKGYGRMVVQALCLALAEQGIETIGLNVTAGNAAAIAMYQALHFRTVMEFVECDIEALRAEQQGGTGVAAQAVI